MSAERQKMYFYPRNLSINQLMKRILILGSFSLALASCQNDDDQNPSTPTSPSALTKSYSGEVVQDYFALQCDITRDMDGFFPTVAARAYGYLGIAAYEGAVHGIPGAKSLAGQIQGFPVGSLPTPNNQEKYNWALVCNTVCAETMRNMFLASMDEAVEGLIAQLESAYASELSVNEDEDIVERSENFGKALADAIYQISMNDGGHESYLNPFQTPYELPLGDYCWIPTDATPTPLSPNWQDNRTFLSNIAETSQPDAHLTFSTSENSEFYQAAMDVYNQVNSNTPEEELIAEYWADDPFQTCTPAGHTFNILKQLLSETGATLEKTVVAFGMLGVCESDAFVSCWKGKYDYMLMRPVTYIKLYIDPNFNTVIGTPPFPAYVSGHSAEIGAGITLFNSLFTNGDGNYDFTDLSQLQYGFTSRTYSSFYQMAEECANSRLYGGIHFEMDNSAGLEMGYAVGNAVLTQIEWPGNIQ